MTLKTDYKDYRFQEGETLRKYQEISNEDGTISFRDVTSYQQEGDRFSASDINSTNAKVNELDQEISGLQTDVSGLQTDVSELQTKSFEGESGTIETKGGYLHDMMIFGKSVQNGTPTPDNPIEIQSVVNPKVTVCGKNLLNIKNLKEFTNAQNLIIGDTSFSFKNSVQNATSMINMLIYLKSGKYFISGKFESSDSKAGGFGVQNLKYDYIVNESSSGLNKSFNIDTDGYYYISFYIDYGSEAGTVITYSDIQLEKGSVATEYEPYKGQSATLPYTLNAIPVSSGGNVTINGQQYISDYVDIENKKLVRYFGEITLDGTQDMSVSSAGTSAHRVMVSIPDIKPFHEEGGTIDKLIICDRIKNSDNSETYNNIQGIHRRINGASQVVICYGSNYAFTSLNDFKNEMQERPLKVIYPLATPTEIDLTDEEVSQFKALQTYVPTSSIIASSDVLNPLVKCDYSLNKETNNIYDRLQENASDVSNITNRLNGLTFVTLTQTEYDALATKDNNTIYFITEG